MSGPRSVDKSHATFEQSLDPAAVFDVVRRHMSPGLAVGYKLVGSGATEVEANGAAVTLSDGREVVDFGSYGLALLGHRHPEVVAAVRDQLGVLPTSTRALANPVTAALVTDLLEACGGVLDRVWLGSDGADAVEVAIKLARRRSDRLRVLSVSGGFHGKTLGALAVTANPMFHAGLEPLLTHVTHLHPGDPDAVRREAARGDVAALIFEPVQGEGGVRAIDPEILRKWAADARAAGAYVISDEIQAGLTRCGPFSLALDEEVRPDAVLFGKALGGGVLPLAAVVATDDLFEPLTRDPTWHSATFGGHPLACAAGRAALRVLDDPATRASAAGLSATLERDLHELAGLHERVTTAVRGRGLLWGIEFRTPGLAGTVLMELGQHGLLVSPCLSDPRTIRLLPPIVTTDAQMEVARAALRQALEEAERFVDDGQAG